MDELSALLALGVDDLRLALHARGGAHDANVGSERSAPPAAAEPPELAALRQQYAVRFRLDGRDFQLVNERVIGKVCWPAAEALASRLLARDHGPGGWRVLLELGAGCALPSLAAATTGVFSRVIATEMTPERVAIAARNAELNGLKIETAELLFSDAHAMGALVGGAPAGCTVCAADVHYNPEALAELVASAASLMRGRAAAAAGAHPPAVDELLLARSSVFAHNDALMLGCAAEGGLRLAGAVALRSGGVLHAASPTLYDPNPNDAADVFRFVLAEGSVTPGAPAAAAAAPGGSG